MSPVRFSIIVPIGPGRCAPILACVDRLDVPGGVEVLIEHGPNPSQNRNRALARARGEICAFADDDCIVDAEWLRAADRFFARHPDFAAVGGPQLTPSTDARFARASGHALGSAFGAWSSGARYRPLAADLRADERSLSSANLFVRRATLEQVGGFDVRLWPNEETDLLVRIADAGGRIGYDPAIVVHHHRRPNPAAFARQCFRYGRGRARQCWLSHRAPGIGALAPALFLLYLTLLPLLATTTPWAAAPLAAYAVASACTAASIGLRERDPVSAVLLPLAFLTVHLGYATGIAVETFALTTGRSELAAVPTPTTAAAIEPVAKRPPRPSFEIGTR